MLTGPNTGLGHNSMVYMIESQIDFVMAHLRALDAAGAKTVEVTEEAERAFNEDLRAAAAANGVGVGLHQLVPRRTGPQRRCSGRAPRCASGR